MSTPLFKLALVTTWLTVISGCAVSTTLRTFETKSQGFVVENKKNDVHGWESAKPVTKDSLIAKWGNPDKTSTFKQCDVLTYKGGLTWSGFAAIFVVVPIPLVYPTGRQENRFYFRNDISVGWVSRKWDSSRMFGAGCPPFECMAFNFKLNEEHERRANFDWCN